MFDFGNVVGFFDYSEMFQRFGVRLGMPASELESMMYERGAAGPGQGVRARQAHGPGIRPASHEPGGPGDELRGFRGRVPGHLHAQRAGGPAGRRAQAARLHAAAGLQHQCPARASSTAAGSARPWITSITSSSRTRSASSSRTSPSSQACLDAVGVPAGSCVFIDDALANVEGARAAGLQAIHYRDTPGLIAELRALGVEVPDLEA